MDKKGGERRSTKKSFFSQEEKWAEKVSHALRRDFVGGGWWDMEAKICPNPAVEYSTQ